MLASTTSLYPTFRRAALSCAHDYATLATRHHRLLFVAAFCFCAAAALAGRTRADAIHWAALGCEVGRFKHIGLYRRADPPWGGVANERPLLPWLISAPSVCLPWFFIEWTSAYLRRATMPKHRAIGWRLYCDPWRQRRRGESLAVASLGILGAMVIGTMRSSPWRLELRSRQSASQEYQPRHWLVLRPFRVMAFCLDAHHQPIYHAPRLSQDPIRGLSLRLCCSLRPSPTSSCRTFLEDLRRLRSARQ